VEAGVLQFELFSQPTAGLDRADRELDERAGGERRAIADVVGLGARSVGPIDDLDVAGEGFDDEKCPPYRGCGGEFHGCCSGKRLDRSIRFRLYRNPRSIAATLGEWLNFETSTPLLINKKSGWPVTNGSADMLKIANLSGASVSYKIAIVGTSA
jgi:hypothetical protein